MLTFVKPFAHRGEGNSLSLPKDLVCLPSVGVCMEWRKVINNFLLLFCFVLFLFCFVQGGSEALPGTSPIVRPLVAEMKAQGENEGLWQMA